MPLWTNMCLENISDGHWGIETGETKSLELELLPGLYDAEAAPSAGMFPPSGIQMAGPADPGHGDSWDQLFKLRRPWVVLHVVLRGTPGHP